MSSTQKYAKVRQANEHPRTIRDDENLSTEDFMDRLRISYATYTQWLEEGLPVRELGRYRRISGYEFNRWAETRPLVRPASENDPQSQTNDSRE